jgi:hypothetical protein
MALKLAFSLPPGTYATMLLRELTKDSTDTLHQSSLTDSSRGKVRRVESDPNISSDSGFQNDSSEDILAGETKKQRHA